MSEKRKIHNICKACVLQRQEHCAGDMCLPYQNKERQAEILGKEMLSDYGGLRFTSDAMDCALPIAMDSHSGCSYGCVYCFANNLQRSPDRNMAKLHKLKEAGTFYTEWPIYQLEKFLAREAKDKVAKAVYPLLNQGMPVQLGALGDPLDDIEEASGWLLKAIPLFIHHGIPVRVGTKGARVMMLPRYRHAFHQKPEQFWISMSLITPFDDLLAKVDINAPSATERLATMKAYAKEGHSITLRFRPFLPGISSYLPGQNTGQKQPWKVLLEKAAEAGTKAVSFEYIFLESGLTDRQKVMYHQMFKAMGWPGFGDYWNSHSQPRESCRRASRDIKYEITKAVMEETHKLGMIFGCSDPHFKEFNDYGCCCGIPDNDPWFGKWSRRQLTNVIVEMRKAFDRGERLQVGYTDWRPEWAHQVKAAEMIAYGSWHAHRIRKHFTFGDSMHNKWNNPSHPRSPYVYFAGVMRPTGVDVNTNDVIYEYRDWNTDFSQKFLGEENPHFLKRK